MTKLNRRLPDKAGIMLRDYEVGPDMLALNDRQRAFVFHLVEDGGRDAYRAAAKAGYQGDPETLRVTASRLAHDERIGRAMVEEAKRRVHASVVLAVSELHNIVADPTTSKAIKVRAIEAVLNRAGMGSSQTHLVKHEVTVTDEEKIKNIRNMADRLGLDPTKLLGSYGITLDGEAIHDDVEAHVLSLTDDSAEVTIEPEEEW